LLQVQENPPGVLVQLAFAPQSAVCWAHSSTSTQVLPSPVQPLEQVQTYEPSLFEQEAF
jgi:hypothetical protein